MVDVARRRPGTFLQFVTRPVPASILLALFTFAVGYCRSFVLPNIPIVLWGDQLGFYNNGSRMVRGELPYRDYFQIVPPGTDLAYALLIKIFGVQVWIPNLVMACLAAITALLMTLIASRLMRGAMILFPGLLLAGFILLSAADATHHWFSTVPVLAATLVLLDATTFPRIAVAGALCGIAACFTQTKGALAVAAFLVYFVYGMGRSSMPVRERRHACLLLCGAAAAVFAAFNAYFIKAAGLGRWLFCVLEYPLRYYSAPSANNWRVLIYDFRWHAGASRWVSFPFVYATVPLVYIVFIVTTRRKWGLGEDDRWRRLLLVTAVGVAMFLAIACAPSGKRLGTVTPPALILLAWLLDRPGRTATTFKTLLGGGAIALAVLLPARIQIRKHVDLDLPGGRAAVMDPALYEEYRWLLANTHPGQYFFGMPPMYSAFHLRNPAAIEGLHPSEYTRPQQVTALVRALEDHPVPLLVLRESRDLLRATDSPHDHLGPFRAYVSQNYRLTKTFPNGDDVLERVEAPIHP